MIPSHASASLQAITEMMLGAVQFPHGRPCNCVECAAREAERHRVASLVRALRSQMNERRELVLR